MHSSQTHGIQSKQELVGSSKEDFMYSWGNGGLETWVVFSQSNSHNLGSCSHQVRTDDPDPNSCSSNFTASLQARVCYSSPLLQTFINRRGTLQNCSWSKGAPKPEFELAGSLQTRLTGAGFLKAKWSDYTIFSCRTCSLTSPGKMILVKRTHV